MFNKGITKIEVLIVIFLILVAVGVDIFVILYLNNKAKDIQILSEVSQIRSGLDLFLAKNNFYPQALKPLALNDVYSGTQKLCVGGFKKFSDSCSQNILNPIPNAYLSGGNVYYYASVDNGQNYKLEFNLETNFPQLALKKGKNCANNNQILSQVCFPNI